MHKNRGFTLIELLVLVTVIGILAAIAMPNFSATIKGDRDIAYTNALAAGLALARSEAIKRGNATICAGTSTACTDSNWSDGWVVFTTAANGTTTLVQTFPATFGATVNSSGGSLFAFSNSGMSFTDNTYSVPAASSFAVCDSRGATYGHSLNLLPSGGAQAGSRVGYLLDGSTPLNCAPASSASSGSGALGIPGLALLGGLLALAGLRKRNRVSRAWEPTSGGSDGPHRHVFGIAASIAAPTKLQQPIGFMPLAFAGSESRRSSQLGPRPARRTQGIATETVAPTSLHHALPAFCWSGRLGLRFARVTSQVALQSCAPARSRHSGTAAGFSLLEVLIALVILSVGLLGIAGLLSSTLKSNDSAYMRTVATVQAYNIIDRMRANTSAIGSGDYVRSMPAAAATSGSTACTGSGTGCSPSQLAAYDIAQWEYELGQNLPQGRGSISTTITPSATTYTVTVRWNDTRANQALQGNASANSSSLSVTSG